MSLAASVLTRPTDRLLALSRSLVADIPADRFARFPTVDGAPVVMNHPAFVLGHLTLYPGRIVTVCGMDPSIAAAPEGYQELFAPDVECVDDPEGTVYPGKEAMIATYFDLHEKAIEVVKGLRDEDFERELDIERHRKAFGTSGGATSFLLGAHAGFHLGQISGWRRVMGLGPAF